MASFCKCSFWAPESVLASSLQNEWANPVEIRRYLPPFGAEYTHLVYISKILLSSYRLVKRLLPPSMG